MDVIIKCDGAGLAGEQIGFNVLTADGKQIAFAMTQECFMQLFVMGWKAAEGLAPAAQSGTGYGLKTSASFAVVNMQPGLVLLSGPLALSIPLEKSQIDYLQERIEEFLGSTDQKH